jgi:hypothetical protein
MRGYKYPIIEKVFTPKDMILYALGIGFSQDPTNKEDFKFTYENDKNF